MKARHKSLNLSASPGSVECRAPRPGSSLTCKPFLFAAVAIAFLAGAAGAAAAAPDDGPAYPVSHIQLRYSIENSSLPPLDDVMNLEVSLGHTDKGYVEPRAGAETVTLRLADIGAGAPGKVIFYQGAIRSVGAQIVHFLNTRGSTACSSAPIRTTSRPKPARTSGRKNGPLGNRKFFAW